jgi:ribosomal protein S18 acetylase RimI-like enzyme
MIDIRRAKPNDAEALARISSQTFSDTFGHLYRREDLDGFIRTSHSAAVYQGLLDDPEHAIWLAEGDSGIIAGYCVAGPCSLPVPNPNDRAGELARLYIAKSSQGARLGDRMLSTALDWLDQRFGAIYLSVWYANQRAQALYAKHGFVKIHDYYYMVGDHADPEWIMERQVR